MENSKPQTSGFSEKKNNILIVVLILLSLGLAFWIKAINTNSKIEGKKSEITTIKKQIDSLSLNQEKTIDSIDKQLEYNSEKSTNLIKNLPNEKANVSDTTYNAMCEYITNYRP